jgi:hypothetical protein
MWLERHVRGIVTIRARFFRVREASLNQNLGVCLPEGFQHSRPENLQPASQGFALQSNGDA